MMVLLPIDILNIAGDLFFVSRLYGRWHVLIDFVVFLHGVIQEKHQENAQESAERSEELLGFHDWRDLVGSDYYQRNYY